MKVQLIQYTPDPEKTVAEAARLCYSSKSIQEISDDLDQEKQKELIDKIMRLGHYSVLEHVCFTFAIEEISRITSHQLVRHRIASFSQRSQRYVKVRKEKLYVVPKTIQENSLLLSKFKELSDQSFNLYQEMLRQEIPAEDARYILPQAVTTSIFFTANARELIHFFRLRCCTRAQWEIREMAIEMLHLVKKIAPNIFKNAGPPCLVGPCPEGELTCGHPWKNENE
ncbi:MAG: FAD-dependent thymidylate synthase [Candidatus Atribacteria bacterium]|nr:FAD-dependent thymidylate synthase [Candidatus Atribacteria bacterium]